MKGYKGFDKDLKCNGYQYEIGKTHTFNGTAKLCNSGFHFCENPLDVFVYYNPADSRFAEIEADKVLPDKDIDSKRVSSILKIDTEISLSALIGAGVKFILEKVDFTNAPATNTSNRSAATNTGNRSAATNTGYQSAATNTGYQSAATNTGNRSAATNTGKEGCAISLGIEGKARGEKGCWLTLAEWKEKEDGWHRINVKTVRVDGKKIKANIFYILKNNKFMEVK